MNTPIHIRIFVSSPGDVAEERRIARDLIKDELPYLPGLRGQVTFDVASWDDPVAQIGMIANETPQQTINRSLPRPADRDIVIVILWSKMGTPLPTSIRKLDGQLYASGTEWEYEDALNSSRHPAILLYRCTRPVNVSLGDPDLEKKRNQYTLIERFFAKYVTADGSLAGGVNVYDTPAHFKDALRSHLSHICVERLKQCQSERRSNKTDERRSVFQVPIPTPYYVRRPDQEDALLRFLLSDSDNRTQQLLSAQFTA